jgi:hypothetical protein
METNRRRRRRRRQKAQTENKTNQEKKTEKEKERKTDLQHNWQFQILCPHHCNLNATTRLAKHR